MRNIYEAPEMEVVKFSLKTAIVASVPGTETPIVDNSDNIIDGDNEDNPFAPNP
ncbi:MAG: hypothetical protein IJC86_01285 [Clostridia bacterium]|nr:hypothetical protein [Clostridia bacterium]